MVTKKYMNTANSATRCEIPKKYNHFLLTILGASSKNNSSRSPPVVNNLWIKSRAKNWILKETCHIMNGMGCMTIHELGLQVNLLNGELLFEGYM